MQSTVLSRPTNQRTDQADERSTISKSEWLLPIVTGSLVACIVYGLIFAHYFVHAPGVFFTGAIQYDQPYYMILARACLDIGNGIAYPNPFSVHIGPIVYSHLFIVITAWVHKLSHLPIEVAFQSLGVICTVSMFCALFFLMAAVQPDKRLRKWMFLLAGLGGSIGWLPALVVGALHPARLIAGGPLGFLTAQRGFVYEGGQWLDSTLLNSVYPTEAFYHTVMFLSLACLALKRYRMFAVCTALVWWSHPFYGVEISFIACIFAFLNVAFAKNRFTAVRSSVGKWLPSALVIAAGFAYYLVYLSFNPEHQSIVEHWKSQAYKITVKYYPIHYHLFLLVPPVVIAASRRVREWLATSHTGRVAVSFTLGVFLLMNHNWLIQSSQPAHFARGYLYDALVILTFLVVGKLKSTNFNGPVARVCLPLLLVLTCLDNVNIACDLTAHPPVLSWMPNNSRQAVQILQSDHSLPLLAASDYETYGDNVYLMREANIRSFASHCATPFYLDRKAELLRYWAGNDPHFLSKYGVDYVLANPKQTRLLRESGEIHNLRLLTTYGEGINLFKVVSRP